MRDGGEAERAEHRRSRVEQDDPGLGRVDAAEVSLEGAPCQLGDLAGHLDARRARQEADAAALRSEAAAVPTPKVPAAARRAVSTPQ